MMKMKIVKEAIFKGIVFFTLTLLISCKATELMVDEEKTNERLPTAAAKPLTQSTFKELTPEQQYQVANRLSGVMYKGVPFVDFFDVLSREDEYKVSRDGINYLADFRKKLRTPLESRESYKGIIEFRHGLDDTRSAAGMPLAQIIEYPVSRDLFEIWMAYILANTILFSPAEEIDSATYIDIQRIVSGLVKAMREDVSIRDIILAHMKSQSNWRRFRSPEDNTREMFEIYLGLFDRDNEVPKASIACKNWSLTDGDANYELHIDEMTENTEPQYVLEQWITTCADFYEAVARHPLVIPRMVTFIVDNFFPNLVSEKRAKLVEDILSTNPVRFHDIFMPIIFSEEFLLRNAKAKTFEETFLNVAKRIRWENRRSFINDLTNRNSATPTLFKMNQPAMSLKLGRFKDQPLDSLSFAFYHVAVRDYLLIQQTNRWGSWGRSFIREGDYFEDANAFVDFLFMSVLARKSTANEFSVLNQAFVDTNNTRDRYDQTRITFDYISQLPELYYSNEIVMGE